MKREDILEAAKECVCGERDVEYGSPKDNFLTIARFWTNYLRAAHPELHVTTFTASAKDVALMMALLKIARAAHGDKADNFIDLAGYAACAGEIVGDVKEMGEHGTIC